MQPRLADGVALTGILFVLRSGLPWEILPAEMGCGSGDELSIAGRSFGPAPERAPTTTGRPPSAGYRACSPTAAVGQCCWRRLIERVLPYQLGAATQRELGPDGVRCTIALPVGAFHIGRDAA